LNSASIFSSSLTAVVGLYVGVGVAGVDPAGVAGLTAKLETGVGAGDSVKNSITIRNVNKSPLYAVGLQYVLSGML
jgi:hypothetical protein